jgi:hypothetical protein
MSHDAVIAASKLFDANSYAAFYIREPNHPVDGRPTSLITMQDCITLPLGFNSIDEYAWFTCEIQSTATILKSFIATKAKINYLQTVDPHNISKEFASPIVRMGITTYCLFHHNVEMSMAFNKLK